MEPLGIGLAEDGLRGQRVEAFGFRVLSGLGLWGFRV